MKHYVMMFLMLMLAFDSTYAKNEQQQQQQIMEVTGTVTDDHNEPLIGVTVQVKDAVGMGAITNVDGQFKLKVPQYSYLVFSYVGMEDKTVFVKEERVIKVVMKESKENVLDEVTVTGTGTQKKITVTGAVTNVDVSELRTPTASITNSFAGVVPGVFARQVTGQPGNNVSEFWIRGISTFGAGSSALVLVDGFERSLNDINVEDIQTFTVLKDASATAIYGSRGANGVVLITTKRGKEGRTRINAKAEYTYSTRTSTPEFVGGVDYARMMNEALTTRNRPAAYSESDIFLIQHQLDPELYPDVNWTDMLLKKGAPTYRANVDFNGGGALARYFVSLSYVNEGGMFKTDDAVKDYNTNANYNRWNYRMNVDMNITPTTLLKVGVSGAMEKQNSSAYGNDAIWANIMGYNPVASPVMYKNGRYGATQDRVGNATYSNPWVAVTQLGYNQMWKNTVQTTANLEQDLGFITKGLKFIGRYGFDIYTGNNNRHSRSPETWKVERKRDDYGNLEFTRLVSEQLMSSYQTSEGKKKEYLEAELHYDRMFGAHQVGAVLKYTQDNAVNNTGFDSGADNYMRTTLGIDRRHQGLAGRFTYGWNYRYYVDFNFGYNGSENFATGNQFGFFPAYSVAWNIGEEPWIKKHAKWIDMFKVRYSYGKVGNDYLSIGGSEVRFPYMSRFNDPNDATGAFYDYQFGDIGTDQYIYNGLVMTSVGSPGITWEVAKKHDVGIDFYLFGNKLSGTIDYFHEQRDGIYMQRNYLPQSIGLTNSSAPASNVGSVKSEGVDGNVAFNQKIGQVNFTLRGNFTYSKNTILEYDEAYSHYGYTKQAGFRVDQARGLIAEGLFTDYDDIRHHADQSSLSNIQIAPGDIKYKDVNGDGKITNDDIVPIGSTTKPNFIYGFGLSAVWKGFDFNVLFQGVGKSSFFIDGFTVYPFSHEAWGNILTDVKGNYWSEGVNEDPHAKYPRLTYGNNSNNNRASTYWLRDGSYMRLKNLEVGYTLPTKLVSSLMIEKIRVYFMGTNLFTFSDFKLWDPELGSSNGQQYPLSRTFTLGLTVSL